ncbi:MAG TPA: DUF86 domain-containing protein, partial [bacterium]|nr:DUF86 domain-containing protein [bacterium]
MSRDLLYLEHMRDALRRILELVGPDHDLFLNDRTKQEAVIRNFEVLGEAAKRISAATRQIEPDVPWRQFAAFRDVLIHKYDAIDLRVVWETAVRRVPDALHKI